MQSYARIRVLCSMLSAFMLLSCAPGDESAGDALELDERISDQVSSAGTKGFFFLPPIAPATSYGGVFEPRLSPEVRIQRVTAKGTLKTIAVYRGGGHLQVRRNTAKGFYVARFRSADFGVDPAVDYRASVSVGGKQLGFADIDVVAKAAEVSKVDTRNFVPLVNGRTLAIRFRIEKLAVDQDGDGVFDWLDNCPKVPNAPTSISADVLATGGALPKGCNSDEAECDPNESAVSSASFKQADKNKNGVGDACECTAGYQGGALNACTDIDECAINPRACDALTTCTNTPGSYQCGACPAGFTGDGKSGCLDIDECTAAPARCAPGVTCANTVGSYQCGACPPGYQGDGKTCTDVDECTVLHSACFAGTTCVNTAGGYTCGACPQGYAGNGVLCTDLDECASPSSVCDVLSSCTNSPGGFACGACPRGYAGNGATGCLDVDECASGAHDCSPLALCSNTAGGFQCGACPPGYVGDGKSCSDVDECAVANGGCSAVVTCTNLPGTFACGACPPHYQGDGRSCVDIDECTVGPTLACDPLTGCRNTVGGFTCSACPAGYTGNGKLGCIDVDECARGADDCSRNPAVQCANVAGSFQCGSCPTGFAGDGKVCRDVDECLTNNGGCDSLVSCTNTLGGRLCGTCPAGYSTAADGSCHDLDECALSTPSRPACSAGTLCTNTPGDYECSACPPGSIGRGKTGCLDIDECAQGLDDCSRNPSVACINRAPGEGRFECGRCPSGYTGDGKICVDINECATGASACDSSALCLNVPGSYRCEDCPTGYISDGTQCVSIDYCGLFPSSCDRLSTCTNVPGGFACGACPAGYAGDGRTGCRDIDECANGSHACSRDPAVSCTNQSGSYSCGACPQGYAGDGKTCTDTRRSQVVTFATPFSRAEVYDTVLVIAEASSFLAVRLSVEASAARVCTITGAIATFIATGTCIINADQAGNDIYRPAPQAQLRIDVSRGRQTIRFTSGPGEGQAFVGGGYNVSAVSSVGLPVSISSGTPSVCTVAGSTVRYVGNGLCRVLANQAGSASYLPARQEEQAFEVLAPR